MLARLAQLAHLELAPAPCLQVFCLPLPFTPFFSTCGQICVRVDLLSVLYCSCDTLALLIYGNRRQIMTVCPSRHMNGFR